MLSEKISCLASWSAPSNVQELQSFLGFCNFYRRFIVNFAALTAPLTNLLKKGRHFVLGPEELSSFEATKAAFLSMPSLGLYVADDATILETDASEYALGDSVPTVLLSQLQLIVVSFRLQNVTILFMIRSYLQLSKPCFTGVTT